MANRKVLFRSGAGFNEADPTGDVILTSGLDSGSSTSLTLSTGSAAITINTSQQVLPGGGDDTGSVGVSGTRWNDGHFNNFTTGDLNLEAPDGSAHWKVVEKEDGIELTNMLTGKKYRMVMEEIID